jgi:SNF2 family DNA or RNA helicase
MNYKFKTKPYAHQLTALEKSWNKENYAYFMEMGTGKTKVLIDNLAMLYDKGKIDSALIIAPKGVVKTWYEQELPAHLPNHIENVSVLWQPNITKTQQEKLDTLFEIDSALHILVMNVEALSTDKGVKFATKFINSHKTLMAIDESTTIKTPTARRTKNIIKMGVNAKYKRIMTGSPITKNPLDLYTQCEFLDPWLLDFSSYYAFRNRYAEMKTMHVHGRSIQVVDKFQNLGELSDTVKQFSYRVLKEDCLDLPPKVFIKRHITLTPDQKKVYEQMKKAAMTVLNGKVTTTMTVLTQLMRLHQITCGYVTADDGSTQQVESNRLNELMSILEDTEGKVIIWANYQLSVGEIIQKIIKVYGKDSYVHYYGLTPQEDRQDFIRKFQMILSVDLL